MLASPIAYTRKIPCGDTSRFGCNDGIRIHIHKIESGLRAPTATLTCQTCACSFGAIDSLSLSSGYNLPKRRSIALGERKYFSGQSAIKISDNVHPPSLLRDSEIRAVKHTPFKRIPQLMYRGKDSSESFPVFVIEKPRDVFEQKISRSPGFSHSDDLMKESASCISKAESSAAD